MPSLHSPRSSRPESGPPDGGDPLDGSPSPRCHGACVVGLGRFERPTSRLSGVRSDRLSYRPAADVTGPRAARAGRDVGRDVPAAGSLGWQGHPDP